MGNGPYQFVTDIPIGGEGGWDILTIDSAASRLYLSHATKGRRCRFCVKNGRRRRKLPIRPGVHGFVALPEIQTRFSHRMAKESKSSVVDLTTLKTISKIDTGANPRRYCLRATSW